MNKKQFIILIGIVVVLGIWGITQQRSQRSSWSSGTSKAAGQKLLGEFDVNAVAQLAIKQGTNELLLAKKDDVWRVAQRGDYPANFGEISALLLKLKNLKVVQTEQVGASQLPRLELATGSSNAPTVVEFRDSAGKAFKTLTLGKKHLSATPGGMDEMGGDAGGFPSGRYVQVSGANDTVAVISDALMDLEPSPGRWINKNFFRIDKPKFISVTFPEATNSWSLTRESESSDWTLADAKGEEKLDAGKAAGTTSPFSSPSLNDVALGLKPEQSGLDQPTKVHVTTFDGFDYVVNVGSKADDAYHLTVTVTGELTKERKAAADEKPEEKAKADKAFAENLKQLQEKLATEAALGKWTFKVAGWSVDPILKKRGELLQEKPTTTEGDGPTNAPAPGT